MTSGQVPEWVTALLAERREALEKSLRVLLMGEIAYKPPSELARMALDEVFKELDPVFKAIFTQFGEENGN